MTLAETGGSWPIGAEVNSSPAERPEPTTLNGQLVTLTPLDPRADAPALYEQTHGPDKE